MKIQIQKTTAFSFTLLGLCLTLSACGPEANGESSQEIGSVAAASTSTWPYPVPAGCVSVSPTQCRTNVGHYDVLEAGNSLNANMAAAGYTQGYSPVCRNNYGYTKGSNKVCYRVGVLSDSHFQVIGSQWSGFRE